MKKIIITAIIGLYISTAFGSELKGDFSDSQICMAAIALMNGHPPVYDNVSFDQNETTLRYIRNTDKKAFFIWLQTFR